jgi:hypothetical protein
MLTSAAEILSIPGLMAFSLTKINADVSIPGLLFDV